MDEKLAWYFTGLIDGEGCFSLQYYKTDNTIRAEFTIRMRGDDTEVMALFRHELGNIGSFSLLGNGVLSANPVRQWKVCNFKELMSIIGHFEKYPLLGKKSKDFAIWRLAVIELQKPSRHRDQLYLLRLYDALRTTRGYDGEFDIPRKDKTQMDLL